MFKNGAVAVLRNCATPPPKLHLAQLLQDVADSKGVDLGLDLVRPPDVQWMIIALATLNKNHPIFSKSYKPEVVQKRQVNAGLQIDNSDGFFTGLPKLTKAKDLRGPASSLLTKQQRAEQKMQKEKAKITKA